MTYSPICANTYSPVHTCADSPSALFSQRPMRSKPCSPTCRSTQPPNCSFGRSACRLFAHSRIHLFAENLLSPIASGGRRSKWSPHLARGRAPLRCAVSYLDRQEMTMPSPPARPSDNRPSGETAIGIPIAYPAISQAISMAMVPEAPMLLRVFRQSNSDHRLIGCDPRRRNSTIAIPIA